MKRQNLLILLMVSLFAFTSKETKASHMVGGEITWECLPNGQYIFKMEIYRECTGTTFPFISQSISYQNDTIAMKPDSNRWLTYGGNGNISAIGINGCQRICNNSHTGGSQLGATQIFPYVSDPVTLNGVPPSGGWLFTWTLCCRPPSVTNLSNPASQYITLRAKMYPYKGKDASQCYDSSPKFHELPAVLFCKGNEYIYNHNPVDEDLDSLVFSWAEPWHQTNTPVAFAPGYSYDNPLPDTSFHPLNIPASLDSQSGEIHFKTYSGQSGQQYATTVQVDSYREGILIASVFRDIPFVAFDCPPNDPPIANINNTHSRGFVDTVVAGEFISIPVQVIDTNTDSNSMQAQWLALAPRGQLFSKNFADTSNCKGSNLAPCATIFPSPVYDTITSEYMLKDQGEVNTFFEWQTDCAHLGQDTGKLSNYKSYNFIFKSYDETCDIPGTIYPSITIVVERYEPKIQYSGNVLYVLPNADSYQWYYNGDPIPNSDTNLINMLSNGWYSVEVIRNGCPSKRAYHLLNVSLDELDLEGNINIYPNPFKDGFIVDRMGNSGLEFKYELMDLSGRSLKIISSREKGKTFINIEKDISQGIYFLKVSSPNSSMIKKLVKM